MRQAGEHRIAASREAVFAALNDPAILARCIAGCEALERAGEGAFEARVLARVGPVSARFTATIRLADVEAPESWRLIVEAKGGAVGFAKGEARVRLAQDGEATALAWEAEGRLGGKLAQIGQRLIDAAARKMAADFFARFSAAPAG